MMTDALLQLSTAQAVTATAVSTNTIDLSQSRDMSDGASLYAAFTVDTAAAAAGAATVTFQAILSASADLSSPIVIASTDALAKTELTAARRPIVISIDPDQLLAEQNGRRYLGVRYVVATGPLTAGAFSCTITNSDGFVKHYPSGFSVV